jgi:hypothetical protein
MFAKQQLNALAARRRLLVHEAELYRRLIGLEREHLRQRAVASGPWLIAGVALTSLLAAGPGRNLARWLPVALSVLRRVWAVRQSPRGGH